MCCNKRYISVSYVSGCDRTFCQLGNQPLEQQKKGNFIGVLVMPPAFSLLNSVLFLQQTIWSLVIVLALKNGS